MNDLLQKQTFDQWLSQHQGLLFKVVRAYAFTPHDQDDLFQEIAIRLWDSIPNYRKESAVTTWIYRVSLYTAISWIRKEERDQQRKQSLAGSEHLLRQPTRQPDKRLDWLYEQISRLDDIDRSVALLHLDGFSHQEIADTLGVSANNIGVRIHRIKKQLIGKSKQEAVL